MTGTAPQPQEIEALLTYWRECGLTHLLGEIPGAIFQPPPRADVSAPRSANTPAGATPTPPWESSPAGATPTPPWEGASPTLHNEPTPPWDITPPAPRPRAEAAPTPQRRAPAPRVEAAPPPVSTPVIANDTPLPLPVPADQRAPMLAELAVNVAACQQCTLCQTRTQTVFGVGTPHAPVVFVGEAPGADEDRLGEPFVGAAGKLLDAMIRAVGFQRAQIYIANVLKCRPPGNRNPLPEEVALCHHFLFTQLEIIQPRLLMAMGKFAISTLTGHDGPVGQARGKTFLWRGIPVIPTYHPAYYLRQPGRKRAAWDDLLRLLEAMEQLPPR